VSVPPYIVEAWTDPATGTFERKAAGGVVPWRSVVYHDRLSGLGRGVIELDAAWYQANAADLNPRLASTWWRVFRRLTDGSKVEAFAFRTQRGTPAFQLPAGGASVVLEGDGPEVFLDNARLYPRDWPTTPTVDSDWLWGGDQPAGSFINGDFETAADGVGGNGGFEDGTTGGWTATPDAGIFRDIKGGPTITTDAITGTYSLAFASEPQYSGVRYPFRTIPGETYPISLQGKDPGNNAERYIVGVKVDDGFVDNSTNGFVIGGYLFVEFGNVAEGTGSLTSTPKTAALSFDAGTEQTTSELVIVSAEGPGVTPTLTDIAIDDVSIGGPGYQVLGWYPNNQEDPFGRGGDQPNITINVFEPNTTDQRSGAQCLEVQLVNVGAARGGPRQIVTGLTPGVQVTLAGFVKPSGVAANFRVVARNPAGAQIGDSGVINIAADTYERVALTVTPTTSEIWLSVRFADAGASPTFYLDDFTFSAGTDAETPGTIWAALFDDADTNHTAETPPFDRDMLGWVKRDGWSGTVDGNGDAWEGTIAFRGRHWERYSQIAGRVGKLGLEYSVKWNAGAAAYEFLPYRAHDPATGLYGRGTVITGHAIHGHQLPLDGGLDVSDFAPVANAAAVEGGNRIVTQVDDAASVTTFGRRESAAVETSALDAGTLASFAAQALQGAGLSLALTLAEDSALPYEHFEVGDRIEVSAAPTVAKGQRRVVSIVTQLTPTGPAVYQVAFDNEVFTGPAASAEAVRRLIRQVGDSDAIVAAPELALSAGAGLAIGGVPSVFVASSEATPAEKELGRLYGFLCDGTDDYVELIAAKDRIEETLTEGRILLSGGTFYGSAPAGNVVTFTLEGPHLWQGFGGHDINSVGSVTTLRADYPGSSPLNQDTPLFEIGPAKPAQVRDMAFRAFTPGDGNDPNDAVMRSWTGSKIARVFCYIGTHDYGWELHGDDQVIDDLHVEGISTTSGPAVRFTGGGVHNQLHRVRLDTIGQHGIVIDASEVGHLIRDVTAYNVGLAASDTYDVVHVTNGTAIDPTADGSILGVHVIAGTSHRFHVNLAGEYVTGWRYADLSGLRGVSGLVQDLGDNRPGSIYAPTFSYAGTLAVGAGSFKFPFPVSGDLLGMVPAVGTAPTGQAIIVGANVTGVDVYAVASRPQIAAGAVIGAFAPCDPVRVVRGVDYLTIDRDQVGSGAAGVDLTVSALVFV